MGFKSRLKEAYTTSSIKRKQTRAARNIIQSKVRAAALRERQIQSIRIAQERERIRANRKISSMRTGYSQNFFGGQIIGPAKRTTSIKPKKRRKTKVKRKKKKR